MVEPPSPKRVRAVLAENADPTGILSAVAAAGAREDARRAGMLAEDRAEEDAEHDARCALALALARRIEREEAYDLAYEARAVAYDAQCAQFGWTPNTERRHRLAHEAGTAAGETLSRDS
jgi:hypothetical protein